MQFIERLDNELIRLNFFLKTMVVPSLLVSVREFPFLDHVPVSSSVGPNGSSLNIPVPSASIGVSV